MNTLATHWPPRLARLYSADVKRLEAKHANALSPGTFTWEDAVKGLYERMVAAGPRKGARLISQAHAYLSSVYEDEGDFMVAHRSGSRTALLVFATFVCGDHPDRRVKEQGITIALHVLGCWRSPPRCIVGLPVCFASKHALNRLFERGDDFENIHAFDALAGAATLGFLVHQAPQHQGLSLMLDGGELLLAGSRQCLPEDLGERQHPRGGGF